MSSSIKIDTRVRSLKQYLNEFEQGKFQIPSFQRDFLWSLDAIKQLFDSIIRAYPIGSILFWTPQQFAEKIGEQSMIGPYRIKQEESETSVFILDGYQRLSALFGCLTNPYKYNNERLELDEDLRKKKFNIFYDLEAEEFVTTKNPSEVHKVPVYIFMNSIDFRQYARTYIEKIGDDAKIEKYLDRSDALGQILNNYQIASVDIKVADINEAVEIFRRVNEKGMPISKDWIVSALTTKDDFRLQSEIDKLLDSLKPYNFEKIKRDVLFQCVQNSFGKWYYDVKIEDIVKRTDFIEITGRSIKAIKRAVQFLYEELLVLNSYLIPYNNQLIFISSFFYTIGDKKPTIEQTLSLKKWFWVTSYSNYFTIYSLSEQRKAYEQFLSFIRDESIDPIYYGNRSEVKFTTLEFPDKISMGSVRSKALTLFMINYSKGVRDISALKFDSNTIRGIKFENLFPMPKKDNPAYNFIPLITTILELNDIIDISKENFYNSLSRANVKNILPSINYSKNNKVISSILLKSPNPDLFINDEMIRQYNDGSGLIDEVLQIRSELIIEAESLFVVNCLGIEYVKLSDTNN